jgi:cytochrome c553
MEVVYQARNMSMTWCLNCHREPERYIRPREEVLNMAYVPPANQLELGRTLIDEYHINVNKLTNCSTCHY